MLSPTGSATQGGHSAQTLTSAQIFSSAPTGFSAQTLSSAQDSSSSSSPLSLTAAVEKLFTVAIDAKRINLSESIAEENQQLLIGRAKIRALMDERGDDRFFDQRNAKREQAQTFDMSTPERYEDRS